MRPRLPVLLAVLLSACTGTSTGDLANDAALDDAEYLALDLANGAIEALPASTGSNLDAWRQRDDRMLFRRLPAGSYAYAGEPGDAVTPVDTPLCWVGVFEVTSAQWARLDGQPPTVGHEPVTGRAANDIVPAVAAFPMPRWRLGLPTSAMWLAAASGGNGRRFAWGDGTADIQAATYAVCLRSDHTTPGLQTVGSLPATGRGFHDLHGNAWELCADAGAFSIRGGAWDSPVMNCRTANRISIDGELAHPLIGFRLVLRP